ncbi:hypothetical protein UFOVP104_25 [uncultured Caudovirales phage]|uniref:Uncharacterized protein n=1 Tax=uncultured Caudovirales phage TaxID=2100421 RepID=A0A6J5L1S9_9CAUD|nr:hypothetical protein UFOVP104_25 [uncultured Caudovirales phage]CAB4134009.1 hypothetical protein UFOVP271_5 [uncultured Caudovirales phage]
MRFNEDWLINQYELRLKKYKDMFSGTSINESEVSKYRALIIATEEFIKDLNDLKESENA